jgi:hypothetical protein
VARADRSTTPSLTQRISLSQTLRNSSLMRVRITSYLLAASFHIHHLKEDLLKEDSAIKLIQI